MTTYLYKNLSDENVINKHLESSITKQGVVYNPPTDVLNPEIEIKYFEGIFLYNYIFIPKFSRYYFIDKHTVVEGNKVRLSCRCDVLQSWWNQGLSNVKCHIVRQSDPNRANFYLVDNKLRTTGRHLTQVKTSGPNMDIILPSNTTAYSYILNTM